MLNAASVSDHEGATFKATYMRSTKLTPDLLLQAPGGTSPVRDTAGTAGDHEGTVILLGGMWEVLSDWLIQALAAS